VGADAAQHLDAVEARHHHVQDHDRALTAQRLLHALFAIDSQLHVEAFAFQIGLEQLGQLDIVIDQQYPRHRRHLRFSTRKS
jgi:hypothetical protein